MEKTTGRRRVMEVNMVDPRDAARNNAQTSLTVKVFDRWENVDLVKDDTNHLHDVLTRLASFLCALRNGEARGEEKIVVYQHSTIEREIIRRAKGEGKSQLYFALRFYKAAMEMLDDESVDSVIRRMDTKSKAAE
jgi:hypothetical protein